VLQAQPGDPQAADIAAALAQRLNHTIENVVILDSVDSTHSAALRIIDHMDSEGLQLRSTVVIAECQTGGLGRRSRQWASPAGGLYLSWIETGLSGESIGLLPMLSAAAAHQAVSSIGLEPIAIKWPNDLLVDGKKLAGILVHARHGDSGFATVGLGVNLASTPEASEAQLYPPTSVAVYLEPTSVREWVLDIASRFVRSLSDSLEDPSSALALWRRHLVHKQGDALTVRLSSGAVESGTYAGLTNEGFLRLRQGSTERVVTGGDVVEN
jgi:BirA family biotin operon repressor/biotin-[acetyl-CoA-carboxylase] ligase